VTIDTGSRSEDRGVPDERYAERLATCREAIAARGFAALLLGVGSDLRYLTGFVGEPMERLMLLAVPAERPRG
jgi:Xaa-Pro aminopeptidase